MTARRLTPDGEQRANDAARTVPCRSCGAPAGRGCKSIIALDRSGNLIPEGSAHLGRVKDAGALHYLPLVEAWVKGELR